jgi:2'-5' RNA ligase
MRLFVAVNLTKEARGKAYVLTESIRIPDARVRWVSPGLFHVTVQFLAEVERGILSSIRQTMDEVSAQFSPFEMEYKGLGVFPSRARPKTVWVGCGYQATLELMQHELALRLSKLGFESDGRRFSPHVTLGRVKRNTKETDLQGLMNELDKTEMSVSDYVESIDLMVSERTDRGSNYECIHRSRLGVG